MFIPGIIFKRLYLKYFEIFELQEFKINYGPNLYVCI